MTAKLRQRARNCLTLLMCVVALCMPGRALHLIHCACTGIVGDACPRGAAEHTVPSGFDDARAKASGCCEIPVGGAAERPAAPEDQGGERPDAECPESCCRTVAIDGLQLSQDGRSQEWTKSWGDDREPQPPHGAGGLHPDSALEHRPTCAAGPADRHRVRRALLERASVMLLI